MRAGGSQGGQVGGQPGALSPVAGAAGIGGQGGLNNAIQSGINAAAGAAADGQSLRGVVQQGVSGGLQGSSINGALNGGAGVPPNVLDGTLRTNVDAQVQSRQSAQIGLLNGVTIQPNGSLQFGAAANNSILNGGLRANDRLVDSSGRIMTDRNEIERTLVNPNGFRVLRGSQMIQLQNMQTSSGVQSTQPINRSVEQKLALIEQLVREVRAELSGTR